MLQVALDAFQTVIDDFLDHTNSYAMARALTETRPAAWVGDRTHPDLRDVLTTWFGSPATT